MKPITILIFFLCLWITVGQTSGGSLICPFAHFRTNSNTCLECPVSCSGCQSLQTPCAGCSEGFRLTTDRLRCEACSVGFQTCTANSISCFRFYTPLNGECRPICRVSNCQFCQSILSSTCSSCASSFVLSNNNTTCIQQTQTVVSNIRRNLQQQSQSTATTTTSTNAMTTNSSNDSRLQNILDSFGIGSTGGSTQSSNFTPINPDSLINDINSGNFNGITDFGVTNPSNGNLGSSGNGNDGGFISTPGINGNGISSSNNSGTGMSVNNTGTVNVPTIGVGDSTFGSSSSGAGSGATGLQGPFTNAQGVLYYLVDGQVYFPGNGTFANPSTISQGGSTTTTTTTTTSGSGSGSGSTGGGSASGASGLQGPFTNAQGVLYYLVDGQVYFPGNGTFGNSSTTSTTSQGGSSTTTTTTITEIPGQTINSTITIPGTTGTIITTNPINPIITNPIITNPVVTNPIITDPITTTTIITTDPIIIPTNTTTLTNTTTQVNTTVTNGTNVINTNCGLNQYLTTSGCLACSSRCSTCINSAQQCIDCNPQNGFMKMGWKCITTEYITFDMLMNVSQGQTAQFITGEGVNEFKRNFITYILPASYAGASLSSISLTNYIYNQSAGTVSVSGVVDKMGNGSITTLGQNISNNIAAGPLIVPFTNIINSNIHTYPIDFNATQTTVIPPTQNNPNGTSNGAGAAAAVAPAKVGKSNLAAILAPSIIGGLILLGLLAALLCYCCKWCCFKKGAGGGSAEQILSHNQRQVTPVVAITPSSDNYTSQRQMIPQKLGNIEQIVTYDNAIQPVPVVSPIVPITTSLISKKSSKIKKVPGTSASIANHAETIDVNRYFNQPIVGGANIYESSNTGGYGSLGANRGENKTYVIEEIPKQEKISIINANNNNKITINDAINSSQKTVVINSISGNGFGNGFGNGYGESNYGSTAFGAAKNGSEYGVGNGEFISSGKMNTQNDYSSNSYNNFQSSQVAAHTIPISTVMLPSVPVTTAYQTISPNYATNNITTSRVVNTNNILYQAPVEHIPISTSNVTINSAPKAVTTVTKKEIQQRERIGLNDVRIIKDIHTREETNLSPHSGTVTNLVSNNLSNSNISGNYYYYQDGKKIFTNSSNVNGYQLYTVTSQILQDGYNGSSSRMIVNQMRSNSPNSRVVVEERIMSPSSRMVVQERVVENRALSPTSTYQTGNIVKHSFKNGQLVSEQVHSSQLIPASGQIKSEKSIQYMYTNNEGNQLPVKSASNTYVQNVQSEQLRNLGIRDIANKADFYDGEQNYTYETKKETRTYTNKY